MHSALRHPGGNNARCYAIACKFMIGLILYVSDTDEIQTRLWSILKQMIFYNIKMNFKHLVKLMGNLGPNSSVKDNQ